MKNQIINRKATIKVAKALGELNNEVVFVGGAMVAMYIDDPASPIFPRFENGSILRPWH